MPLFEDCVGTINIGGFDFDAREHSYQANVTKLADGFKVTLPAPDGYLRATDGSKVHMKDVVFSPGLPVRFSLADPEVQNGRKIEKLTGVKVGAAGSIDAQGGTQLIVTGADLGYQLSTCGPVKQNLRGLTWTRFLEALVLNPALGFGFKGVRGGNLINQKIRLGRQVTESDFQQETTGGSIIPPRFQIEVGQTLDSLIIEYARLSRYLVNVSTDGYFCFFRPASEDASQNPYTAGALYEFHHHADHRRERNNVMRPTVEIDESELYTHVECWNTVIDRTDIDDTDPNAGRYHGEYTNLGTLPFQRRLTFCDPEQIGQDRVDARAKWAWQRGQFVAETHSFDVVGHSQNGIPFVEDTMAHYHNSVFGVDGLFYVVAVEPSKKLARAGFDTGAGSRTHITLKRPNFLAA